MRKYTFFFREERGRSENILLIKSPNPFRFSKLLLTKKKSLEICHLINQDATIHLFFRNWSELNHKVDSSHSWYDFDKSFTISYSFNNTIYWYQFSEGSCFKKYIVQSYVKTLFFWFWDGQIFYKTKTHKIPSILHFITCYLTGDFQMLPLMQILNVAIYILYCLSFHHEIIILIINKVLWDSIEENKI